MHVSKEKPLSNVDRAKFEGILTDFDMAFNEELLYQRNEDMQSQSSQFKSAGIEQLLQEFKSAVTPNVRKNVEMMIRSLTLTLTQTGDTPFGTKLTKALAAQTEKAVSCVYGGNVDMLKMDEKERKRLLEQYNTDMEDKKYKEKALKRQFEEANEKVEKTQKRLGEIEEKLANKIAENIRLTEENDTLQGSKQEMSKSLTSMKSMYDNDLASREKLQTRCDDLNREKTNLENKITELETRLAHKRKPTSPDISSSSSEKVSELEIQLEAKVKAVTKITKELSESRSMIQSLKDSLSARDDELKKLRENPPTLMTSTSSTTGPPEIPTKQSQDGEETKEEKTSDDSDVPEGFKPEFCPMIVALTTSKHLKKWKALSSLSKGKPLGVKPEDVPVEIAEEFVNTFIPSVRGVTLSLSLTISHTHIKEPPAVQSSTTSSGGGGGGQGVSVAGSDPVTLHFNLYSPDSGSEITETSIKTTLEMVFQALFVTEPSCEKHFRTDSRSLAGQIATGMVQMADTDKNGKLNIEEFKKFFKPKDKSPLEKLKEDKRFKKWVRLKTMIKSLSETNMRGKMKASGTCLYHHLRNYTHTHTHKINQPRYTHTRGNRHDM